MIFDISIDVDVGGIFVLRRFYVKSNRAGIFLKFFFYLMIFIENRFGSVNERSNYRMIWESSKNKIKKRPRTKRDSGCLNQIASLFP